MSRDKNFHFPVRASVLFVLLALFAVISYYIPLNEEGLRHYNCLSFSESWHCATLSYVQKNPRFGEMAAYFLGRNAENIYFILNTLFFFSSVLLIFRAGTGRWPGNTAASQLTLIFIAITVCGFTTDTTWFLANMSWYYPCTLAIGLFCITEKFFKGDFSLSISQVLLALPLAFISGMGNNNSPIVIWLLLAGAGIYRILIKRQSKPSWQYALIMLVLSISCLIFYTAPGSYARAKEVEWEFSFNNILWNSVLNTQNWLFCVILLWRLLLSLGIQLWISHRDKLNLNLTRVGILWLGLSMLLGVLMLAPWWGMPRSLTSIELVLACILAHFFYQIATHKRVIFSLILLLTHAAIMSTSIIPIMCGLVSSHREWKRIETMAQQVKAHGKEYLIVRGSDLDMSPAISRLWKVPGSVFQYRISPVIPLIPTTPKHTTHTNHKHKWLQSTWTPEADSGDHIMNPIAAKKLGLKAVYYLPMQ